MASCLYSIDRPKSPHIPIFRRISHRDVIESANVKCVVVSSNHVAWSQALTPVSKAVQG
ncbi:uncharacterized protein RSE6_00032 [Rhynchosporium secalis]|uniref:Uncharacterized protein n=1 Tax=Rhynchosporium secalis TaxID=38038 RepID=A0A1E1LU83_RHYSE|nr:uncharacterized protein RSE6_00032 [Rhynchosporium secalis]